jgi:6-phosphogluconate dehydrogenase
VQVGLIGLGRMGANISRRWLQNGHTVFGYARTKATVDGLVAEGALSGGASSLSDLVAKLEPRSTPLWINSSPYWHPATS